MDLKVIWTQSAISELENIFDYYKSKASAKVAKKITNSIVQTTTSLRTNPKMGRIEELLISKTFEYRFLIEGTYKIIYFINNNFVVVASVFDCRRDPNCIRNITNLEIH